MNERVLFQKNASVLTARGKKIGSLKRVVLNPDTKVVTDIVVRTNGRLFTKEDKVVSIDLVDQTTESEIVLEDQAGELQYFPHFEIPYTVDADKPQNDSPVVSGYAQVGPVVLSSPKEPVFIPETEQNIPEDTIAMKDSAKVITAEGKHVGNLERVIADSSVDQITHLIMSAGIFAKDKKLIPIRWVGAIGEDEIRLKVDKKSIEESDSLPVAG